MIKWSILFHDLVLATPGQEDARGHFCSLNVGLMIILFAGFRESDNDNNNNDDDDSVCISTSHNNNDYDDDDDDDDDDYYDDD